ncbi:MAG TPA: methyltransferase domain-containing protein [Acidimicrobiia bacterium]|nr:methyltransferase domain-containing protein [Acidimicrobiia bacterium]
MGVYAEQLVPRVTNLMLGSKPWLGLRREVCEGLHGDVVEIGFGSGLNVPYLPPEVTGLWAVDPARVGMKLAAKRIAASPIPVHPAGLDGEHLDLPDDRFDGALSTMTLCTIPDAVAALREVRRVLKPGASFHFFEHGGSPDAKVARFQRRYEPIQRATAGGCHLTRDIPALIKEGGFEIESLRSFYQKGPKAFGYMFVGRARKS